MKQIILAGVNSLSFYKKLTPVSIFLHGFLPRHFAGQYKRTQEIKMDARAAMDSDRANRPADAVAEVFEVRLPTIAQNMRVGNRRSVRVSS